MRITPRDWRILKQLDQHGRLTSGIIAHENYLDEYQSNVSESLARLQDYELVSKVGPNNYNSGLYEIELRGMAALDVKQKYESEDNEQSLEELIEEWIGQ